MNFIHSEKTIWILPERTATRTIGQLLNFWEVVILEGGEYKTCVPHKNLIGEFAQGLRHEWDVSELFLDYEKRSLWGLARSHPKNLKSFLWERFWLLWKLKIF